MWRRSLAASLAAAFLVSACADPPNKEIGQAQGAIDTARAAGADRYAADEYTAATKALAQAADAVSQRDYRLALNHAIESREHAQNAAREAAERRAQVRSEVERSMADVATLLAHASSRMTAAEDARIPRRTLRETQQALAQVNDDVQKAGAAMQAEDYLAAQRALAGVKERIEAVNRSLDQLTTAQAVKRKR
jgi:hypothetical protein